MNFVQMRLVVVQVHLGWAARLEQVNDSLGLRLEIRKGRAPLVSLRVALQQRSECGNPNAAGTRAKKVSPVDVEVEFC